MKKMTSILAALMLVGSSFAANPFSDVPRTHWAYSAIQRAVDAGILQGFDGKFHGDKLVNRYQMAVIIKKILDAVGTGGGGGGSSMSRADVRNLEALTIEFADELALLNVKVSTLEDSFTELRNDVSKMKMGRGHGMSGGGSGLGSAFTGFVSVGLISTDEGTTPTGPPPGGTTRFTGTTPDQTFFTIPQASIALDTEVGDGIGLHVQYDYTTDGAQSAGLGGGVGLNEAYLFVDELFGDIGGKIGGFALPFQSWEINGPFRSSNKTITASAKNTFLESVRVVGFEAQKTKDVDPSQVQWKLGVFVGPDVPLGVGAPTAVVGPMNDAVGLGALTGTTIADDSFGYYLDLESGKKDDQNWGWRLGFFDIGGDASATAPATPSEEIDGYQVGFWWKNESFKVLFEWLGADNQFAAAGPGNESDINAWYLLVNYKINDDSNVSLRWDDFENEVGAGGSEGDALTLAWNKKISDTSMFQFEFIANDWVTIGAPAGADTDLEDNLLQFRYKVWF